MSRPEHRAAVGPPPPVEPRRASWRTAFGIVLVLAAANALIDAPIPRHDGAGPAPATSKLPFGMARDDPAPDGQEALCDEPPPIVLPTGAPAAISCDDARRIIAQARAGLASPGRAIDPHSLADATADWLDPHGLWSAAPDAPTAAVLHDVSVALLRELEAPAGSGPCTAASAVGGALVPWVSHLRAAYASSFEQAAKTPTLATHAIASNAPFEDGELTRSAPELASELGRVAGSIRAAFGLSMAPYLRAAAERTTPDLPPERWAEVVLAAAVRAYVPLLDAHGAWAPLDEETSIYDFDLLPDAPPRLWGQMTRTAVGVRIDASPLPPLQVDDLVLRVHGTALAGMSVEQTEQFALLAEVGERGAADVVVLRRGESAPRALTVVPAASTETARPSDGGDWPLGMTIEPVPYGAGVAAIIVVPDVPDDLGYQLSAAVTEAVETYKLQGIVLDVRDNGGGSTDGALDALSLLIPGAAMFPMRRRDGGIEVERTAILPERERYRGPIAVMIDGNSASAAEMIAGAIQSYGRGVLAGATSYGKGCAQEYLDDDAGAGVLRLTTLLFALPDGSPVQRVGVHPDLALRAPTPLEREASIPHALAPWRGPDVRDGPPVERSVWPRHAGHVGPCSDEAICRTLRAIGSQAAASR